MAAEWCFVLAMDEELDDESAGGVKAYVAKIGASLGHAKRRASFALYFQGLMGDGARKSMEPIAAKVSGDPKRTDAAHQQIGHFISDSTWDDHAVRAVATWEALEAMTARESVVAWTFDDTGFLKQGKHSVGVQRQYTGSAGKIANCQLGVSLTISTSSWHVPCDFELYLPEDWLQEPRRSEARIPKSIEFRTKPQLALDMMERAIAQGYPRGVILGDTAYGDVGYFRQRITELGFEYALGVQGATLVRRVDKCGRCNGPVQRIEDFAKRLDVRRVTWRNGTQKRLTAKFSFCRVVPASTSNDDTPIRERMPVWLVVEYRDDTGEIKYYLSSLPEDTPKKQLAYTIKERYRTEQVYRELKGELGLDHFEGRRFTGWHHHVTVALCCYAFVVAVRARAFPPSGRWPGIPPSLLQPS
jgi:SRSO17 transposase